MLKPAKLRKAMHKTDQLSENPLRHESANAHVSGRALFIDDIPEPAGMLFGGVLFSQVAAGRIIQLDISHAVSIPGVHRILTASDIPGENQMGPVVHDEPCLAVEAVQCIGQAICLVAAESPEICRLALSNIVVEIEPIEAITDLDTAIERSSFFGPPRIIRCGDFDAAYKTCAYTIEGTLETGAQEHWYLETQASLCIPGDDGGMMVHSSSQNPTETQAIVAEVLGIGRHAVTVEVKRMGGGFGGKETQANPVAAWAALLANATSRPVKIRLTRDEDQKYTGKRHPFRSFYKAGFDAEGYLQACQLRLFSDGGCVSDLSWAILERALFHVDNAYYIPNLFVSGQVCRTNLPSNTAFRGFGGPQGIAVTEHILECIASKLSIDPVLVRQRNFYGTHERNTTHYGQVLENNRLALIYNKLIPDSSYFMRKLGIEAFNQENRYFKRGISMVPVKFGISFTTSFLNQAGSLIQIYQDGTVVVNHGGTEMGQGLHTKIRQIAATELGIDPVFIRVEATNTGKVPNTSATAASSGTDLNGMAVKNGIGILKNRLAEVATGMISEQYSQLVDVSQLQFSDNLIVVQSDTQMSVSFKDVVSKAYFSQVSLSAAGYYKTPGIHWDKEKGKGKPFYYFSYGMAVSEVEVDVLTGHVKLLRTDILHDVGKSVNHEIDLGQVRGAFIQGVGWVTTEDVKHNHSGQLLNASPDTYKIPVINDIPDDFRVELLEAIENPGVIHGSKAVGEPPFVLGLSVWLAVRNAIGTTELGIPATNEHILLAINRSL